MNPERDNAIIKALKVEYLIHPICKTTKGELAYMLRKGEDKYILLLDSVPYENDELETLLK